MRGREGVVDVELAEACELIGECRIVLLLAGVEAEVLEQEDAARLERRDRALRRLADAVLGERDLDAAQRLAQRPAERAQRHRALALALGPAEMGQHHDLGVFLH